MRHGGKLKKPLEDLIEHSIKLRNTRLENSLIPENHERREKRMLDRKRERWTENYTYFFGGLTEEEQMYRDYFETDIEQDPEDEHIEE
jgi:hypothetical protein